MNLSADDWVNLGVPVGSVRWNHQKDAFFKPPFEGRMTIGLVNKPILELGLRSKSRRPLVVQWCFFYHYYFGCFDDLPFSLHNLSPLILWSNVAHPFLAVFNLKILFISFLSGLLGCWMPYLSLPLSFSLLSGTRSTCLLKIKQQKRPFTNFLKQTFE